jgi:hypothetical protein
MKPLASSPFCAGTNAAFALLVFAAGALAQSTDAAVTAANRDAAVAAQSAVSVAAPVVPAVSPFEGTWRFAGGDAQRQALERALQSTVSGMGFIVEGMALSRLRDRNQISPTIVVHVANGQLEYTAHNGRMFRSPVDGTAVRTQNAAGEAISLQTRINGNTMTRHGAAEQGARNEVLRVEGSTMTIDCTLTSPRLPRPLRYQLTYRR